MNKKAWAHTAWLGFAQDFGMCLSEEPLSGQARSPGSQSQVTLKVSDKAGLRADSSTQTRPVFRDLAFMSIPFSQTVCQCMAKCLKLYRGDNEPELAWFKTKCKIA